MGRQPTPADIREERERLWAEKSNDANREKRLRDRLGSTSIGPQPSLKRGRGSEDGRSKEAVSFSLCEATVSSEAEKNLCQFLGRIARARLSR